MTYYSGWNVHVLSPADQLLVTLMKLCCNVADIDIAFQFQISAAAVRNVTHTWISLLHEVLYVGIMVKNVIPSRAKNQGCLPAAFVGFRACRVVLDCTEVQVAIPTAMDKQRATFFHYKQRNTFKAPVGFAPNRVMTFSSNLYPGCTSDREIVLHSKVLNQMNSLDMVIVDKGYLI